MKRVQMLPNNLEDCFSYCLYSITNAINGRVYVGQSSDYRKRWAWHIRDLEKQRHSSKLMQADYREFGLGYFKFAKIGYYASLCDALFAEARAIQAIDQFGLLYNNSKPDPFKMREKYNRIAVNRSGLEQYWWGVLRGKRGTMPSWDAGHAIEEITGNFVTVKTYANHLPATETTTEGD